MRLGDTEVVDTFAEAFGMWGTRIVVTAESPTWA
jgi:formylmethanofuran:tetrahydromethanopterin formyltransferase